jgi:multidrug efflux system membrane fusion protein
MMNDEPIAARPPTGSTAQSTAPHRGSWTTRVVLLLLLAAAIGGSVWLVRARGKAAVTAAAAAASAMQNRVVPVLTVDVVQRDVPVWREGLGSVAAFYTVTVKTQVDGRIDRVAFKEGQRVKKGDLLVQIDPRPFAIQLESAQAAMARDAANMKNAQLNADRYKTLSQQNLISVQQYTDQQASVDQLAATVASDKAMIDTARLNLDYARITTPIDGVTGVRLVDPGNVVHAADTTGLVIVTQLDPIALLFTLPEDDLGDITAAMAASKEPLPVDAVSRDGDQALGRGKLSLIDNEINQATATIRLKAIFDNPQSALWPNQFVKARLRLSTRKNAITVPAAVVQHGPSGTFAYVVTGTGATAAAEMRPIVVAATQGDVAVIQSGLTPGEQVVVEGQAQLRPGAKVAPRPASSAGANGRAASSASASAASSVGPASSARGGPSQ